VHECAASSITAWLALFVLVWYVFLRKKIHKKTWPGWNFEFMSWSLTKEFLLEQGIPAGVATSLEELQLEVKSWLMERASVQVNFSFKDFLHLDVL
jgi:Na+-driven multidrug efflux pump